MTRFERGERFVELELRDAALHHRWGRTNHAAYERVDTFDTHLDASEAMQRQLRRFEHRGYRAGRHHPELEAVLKSAPEHRDNYLVYADWLLSHGDPRGLLIMTMASGAEADALLDEHAVQFKPLTKFATYTWHLGFITRVVVLHPTWGSLRQLLRHPSALVLRTLALHEVNLYDVRHSAAGWRAVLQHLPSTVTRIELEPQSPLLSVWGDVPHVRALPSDAG